MHQLIVLFFYGYTDFTDSLKYVEELQKVCTISGAFTFGIALYGTLSLKFAYKLISIQFVLSKFVSHNQ
jgi:hypothetical protein